jgi:hypothetical protein
VASGTSERGQNYYEFTTVHDLGGLLGESLKRDKQFKYRELRVVPAGEIEPTA